MRRIQISKESVEDLIDGFRFYEAQDQGPGDYFTACLRADIESLRLYAGIHPIIYQDYHRLLWMLAYYSDTVARVNAA